MSINRKLSKLANLLDDATDNQYLVSNGNGELTFNDLTVSLIDSSNAITNSFDPVSTIRFDTDSGFDLTDLGSGAVKVGMNSTFKTWQVAGQDDLVALGLDTIEFVAGTGMTITTDATTDPKQIIFESSGTQISTTDDLSEGSSNLYFTDARARNAITNTTLDMQGNKVLFGNMYATLADLPSATTYHGMFAHVHATGKAYFAHNGNWVELLDSTYTETTTTLTADSVNQKLVYTDETGTANDVDLSWAVDDTNLARLTSGTLNNTTGIATFTRDDSTTFTVDFSALFDDTNNYADSVSFSGGTLTIGRSGSLSDLTVSLDGRYLQSLGSVGGHTDVDITTTAPTTGQALVWDGSNFVPGDSFSQTDFDNAFALKSIDALSDVDTSTNAPASGDALVWDGSNFVPGNATANVTVSTTAPSSPEVGDVWLDEATLDLYVYYPDTNGNIWVQVNNLDVPTQLNDLTDVNLTTAPTSGQTLVWDATNSVFIPGTIQGYTTTDFNTDFAAKTTTDLTEGTNLYYTDTRVDTRISNTSIDALNDVDTSTTTANNGQALVWDGTNWVPGTVSAGNFTETVTTLTGDSVNQRLQYTDEAGTVNNIDLSWAVDDTNLARITSGTLNNTTGIATFTRDDSSTFTVDFSALFDDTNNYADSVSFSGGTLTIGRTGSLSDLTVSLDGRYIQSLGSIGGHTDVDITTTAPSSGDALVWDGSNFVPGNATANVTVSTSAPTSPEVGDVWLDEATLDLYVYYPDTNGNIWVQVNNLDVPTQLNDLTDVDLTTLPTNGQTLVWNSTTSVFEPGTIQGYTTTDFNTDFGNKTTDDLSEGSTNLYFTNTRAETVADARIAAASINALTDVDTATNAPTVGEVLRWDGSNFVPGNVNALETLTTLTADSANSRLQYTDEAGTVNNIDLSWAVDDTNLARLVSGSLNGSTGIATFTRDDSTTFTVDFSPFFDDTNLARITSGSISGNTLTLTRDDASTIAIDVSSLIDIDSTSLVTVSGVGTNDIDFSTISGSGISGGINYFAFSYTGYAGGGYSGPAGMELGRKYLEVEFTAKKDGAIGINGTNVDLNSGNVGGVASNFGGFSVGDVLGIVYDTTTREVYYSKNGGNWSPTDPNLGAGYSISGASGVAVEFDFRNTNGATGSNISGDVATGGISYPLAYAIPPGTTPYSGTGTAQFLMDGAAATTLSFEPGRTYIFDQSDATNLGHPLKLSETSDGTHNSGSEYTIGVTTVGSPGTTGAYTQIVVNQATPHLYYYCANHSGMGGGIAVGNVLNVGDLADVDTTTTAPTDGQALVWDNANSKFVPGDSFSQTDFDNAFALKSIDALSDVDTTTAAPTSGDTLVWDGSNFVPGTAGAAVTVSATAPTGATEGDLWLNEDTLALYAWYVDSNSSQWVHINPYIDYTKANISATAPSNPDTGDLWVDEATLDVYIYTGSAWAQVNQSNIPTEISDLVDVDATGVADGQALIYNVANSRFEPGIVGATVVVQNTAPTGPSEGDLWYDEDNGDMFVYVTDSNSNSAWVEVGGTDVINIDDLSDVDTSTTAPTAGQALIWDGTNNKWVPGSIIGGLTEVVQDTTPQLGGDLDANNNNITNISTDGYSLPTADGTNRQVIMTDGFGTLSFEDLDTIHTEATNQTGSTILKGTPVYQTGTSGNAMTVAPADASSASTMPAVGVLEQDLAAGATGFVIHMGQIRGIDTSSFAEGDTLFVAIGGGYTNTAPTGEGNLLQNLGRVTKVHASNGGGIVMGAGRTNAVPNLNDGNIFIGNASNQAITAALTTDLLGDVDTTTAAPTNGQALVWDGSNFVPTTISLTETTTTLTADSVNQKLVYTDETGTANDVDLSWAVDDTNLARITSGTLNNTTGIATFTRDDSTTFTVDFSALFDDTNNYADSVAFSGGTLTIGRTGSLSDLTVSLDGRYLQDITGESVGDLNNVDITTTAPTDGQALVWDNANSKFVPGDSFSQTDFDNAFALKSIDALSDVDTTTAAPTTGDALVWDGSNFVPGNAVANVTVSTTAPSSPEVGDVWLDEATLDLYIYYPDTNGNIWVQVNNLDVPTQLNDLTDVDTATTAPTTGDALVWDGTNFIPQAPFSQSDFDTAFAAKTLDDLSDVNLTVAPTDGQSIVWDNANSQWIAGDSFNQTDFDNAIALKSIDVLSDVDTTTAAPVNGQVLKWDGSNFVPSDTGGRVTYGASTPSAPGTGDIWIDSANNDTYVYDGTNWSQINQANIPTELSDLIDVDASGVTNGQTLVYNSTTSQFEAGTMFSGNYNDLTNLPTLVGAIDDLSDVDTSTTAPTSGDILSWDGSNFVPVASTSISVTETTTTLTADSVNQKLVYTDETGTANDVDLSWAVDDTNLARITSGTLNNTTGIATFTRDDSTTFTVDFSALFDDTNTFLSTLAFDTGTGVLTGTLNNSTTVTVDLDGRYLESLGSIDGHTDVDITTTAPTDGQALVWDNANSKFVPGDSFSQTDFDNAFALKSVDALSDVDTTTNAPTTGDALVWDGSNFVPGNATANVSVSTTAPSSPEVGDVWLDEATLDLYVYYPDTNGNIWVQVNNLDVPTQLNDLTDVNLTTAPTDGQALVWDNANSVFVPGDSFSQTDFDNAFALKSIDALSDVDTTTAAPTNGQALVWDGSNFVPGDRGIFNVVEDTTPQLGGDLDLNSKAFSGTASFKSGSNELLKIYDGAGITSIESPNYQISLQTASSDMYINAGHTSAGNMRLATDSTDRIEISSTGTITFNSAYAFPTADGTSGQVLQTDGSGNLTFATAFSQSDFDTAFALKSIDALSDVDITTTAPTTGETLVWDGSNFVPGTSSSIDFGATAPSNPSTGDVWIDNANLDTYVYTGSAFAQINQSNIPSEISDLIDADTTGIANGQVLVWNSTNTQFEPGDAGATVAVQNTAPGTPSEGDLWYDEDNGDMFVYVTDAQSNSAWVEVGGTDVIQLNDLSDVDLTTNAPTNGQVLVYDAALSTFVPGSQSSSIGDLTDVDITTNAPTDGQLLTWNATSSQFVPTTFVQSGGGASVEISANPPASPTAGDLWIEDTTMNLYVYYDDPDSNQWVQINNDPTLATQGLTANVATGDNPPSPAQSGDIWYNTTTGSMFVYYQDVDSSQWVEIVNPFGNPGIFELDGITAGTTGQVLTMNADSTATFNDLPFIPGDLSDLTDTTSIIPEDPAIEWDGTTATLATGVVAADLRTLIGAGTSSFDGSYNSLTDTPTIPSDLSELTDSTSIIPTDLTDLGIADGTINQVLKTDGAGNFAFANAATKPTAYSGDAAPTIGDEVAGDLWYNTTDGSLYVYYQDADTTQWVQVVNPFAQLNLFDLEDITDGTANQVLTTDGAGNATFQDVPRDVSDLNDSTNLLYTDADVDSHLSTTGTGLIKATVDSSHIVELNRTTDAGDMIKLQLAGVDKSTIGLDENDNLTVAGTADIIINGTANVNLQVGGSDIFVANATESLINSPLRFGTGATNTFMNVEGATDDAFETAFTVTEPTADRTVTFKDETGTVALISDIPTDLTDLGIVDGTINQVLKTDGAGNFTFEDAATRPTAYMGDNAPNIGDERAGDLWYNSTDGSLYVYYEDVDSTQWTQVVNPFAQLNLFDLEDITDGTANQVLTTDGAGNATFQDVPRDIEDLTDATSLLYTDSDVDTHLSTNGTGLIKAAVDSSHVLELNRTTDSGDMIVLQQDGVTEASIGIDATDNLVITSTNSDTIKLVSTDSQLEINSTAVTINKPLVLNSGAGNTFLTVEGTVDDTFETQFVVTEPTADRTVTFKDEDGTVAYVADLPTALTDLGITDGTLNQLLTTDGAGNFSFADREGVGIELSDTAPATAGKLAGDLWYNTNDGSLYILYEDVDSTQWVQIINPSPDGWAEVSGNYTAQGSAKLFVDTSVSAVTITLPASPVMGQQIHIIDGSGNAATNNITVARNGNLIDGAANDISMDYDRATLNIVYYNAANGWVLADN